ncbi:MAG: hypothetical protein AB8U25_01505 [Rickettsiales endosymbiont of Dermacentor nuttalli]
MQSFLIHRRTIYCTKDSTNYAILKWDVGFIHTGIFHNVRKEEVIAVGDTCNALIDTCIEKFGEEFIYIQSSI